MYIKLKKGLFSWHYVLQSKNGQILSTSETYYSKSNAIRAAKKLAKSLKVKVVGL